MKWKENRKLNSCSWGVAPRTRRNQSQQFYVPQIYKERKEKKKKTSPCTGNCARMHPRHACREKPKEKKRRLLSIPPAWYNKFERLNISACNAPSHLDPPTATKLDISRKRKKKKPMYPFLILPIETEKKKKRTPPSIPSNLYHSRRLGTILSHMIH